MILMARYGMLDCAANYHGKYKTKICEECKVIDNEDHRINHCKRWEGINLYGTDFTLNFNSVFSNDLGEIHQTSSRLGSIWNIQNGKNEMRSRNVDDLFTIAN